MNESARSESRKEGNKEGRKETSKEGRPWDVEEDYSIGNLESQSTVSKT